MSSSGRPLRLLFVGNPESIHLCRWVRFFVERGHEAHVAGLGSSRPDDDNAPFPIHRLGHPAAAVVGLRRLARRLSADLVHAHYLTHYGWLARLVGQTPFAVTLWGSDILLDLRGSPVRRAWARLVLRAAACVTADSPQIVDLAVGLGARPARIHEIQFGIDIKRFAPGPRPDELLEALGLVDRRIVFAPRAIRPLYRTDLLVRALRSLPDDVVLLGTLAGADPGFVGQVMSEAAITGRG